jgi:tRNA(fMet)-specific endonuclease VapC
VVIIDTNIIVTLTKINDPKLLALIKNIPGTIPGIVRAEILTGARTLQQRQLLLEALNSFFQLPFPETLWDTVGENNSLINSKGITLPFNDVAIATLALHYDIELWTRDKQFQLLQNILTKLKLFQEPP